MTTDIHRREQAREAAAVALRSALNRVRDVETERVNSWRNVSAALRASRLCSGFTTTTLALRLGVNRSLVTHWETGRKPVPEAKCEALLQALMDGQP